MAEVPTNEPLVIEQTETLHNRALLLAFWQPAKSRKLAPEGRRAKGRSLVIAADLLAAGQQSLCGPHIDCEVSIDLGRVVNW